MAEADGFTFPDRCFSCRDIVRCLNDYQAEEAAVLDEFKVAGNDIVLCDADLTPAPVKHTLSPAAEKLIIARWHTAQAQINFSRRLTQQAFDYAEMYCLGSIEGETEEPDEGISLKDCQYPGKLLVRKTVM